MTSEEFWKDDPQLFVSYRTSFINKQKRLSEERDYLCWLQGLYIYDGNTKLFSSLKQFIHNIVASIFKGGKDNSKIESYPMKPYTVMYEEKENEKKLENKKQENSQKQKDFENLVYFGTLKQRYLNELKNKKGE